MVQNEINNMSFLTADSKSKMAKVGALLSSWHLVGREGAASGESCPTPSYPSSWSCAEHTPCGPHDSSSCTPAPSSPALPSTFSPPRQPSSYTHFPSLVSSPHGPTPLPPIPTCLLELSLFRVLKNKPTPSSQV